MKSKPYLGVSDEVKKVARRLLDGGDDYHLVHMARLARTLDLVNGLVPAKRVLEVGTTGFFPIALKSLFPSVPIDVTHFDLTRDEVSEMKVECAGETRTVTAFAIDLEYSQIPAADETYDVVICGEVLEHMEIDPMFMLAEVNRVLETGGTLVLTTPNVLSSRGLRKMLDGYEPYFYMQYHKTREYHRHNYEYSVKRVWQVLNCAGFDATVWTEDLFEDGLPAVVNELQSAGFVIGNVGDNIIALARKVSGVVERFPNGLYV